MNAKYFAAVIGLALIATAPSIALAQADDQASSMHDHEHMHGDATMQSAPDEHAAHRAAMKKARYAVSEESYDIPEVELLDTSGTRVKLRELLNGDKPVALNFIFTTCTTICPVMTATFAQMRKQLGESASEVELVSISIDPEYDRPEILAAYAKQFGAGPGWTFLTGDSGDIERVLRSFDAYAGSKMNHKPLTLMKRPTDTSWVRIDGLAGGAELAQEVTARLLN
jgi:protein SCO1/2